MKPTGISGLEKHQWKAEKLGGFLKLGFIKYFRQVSNISKNILNLNDYKSFKILSA